MTLNNCPEGTTLEMLTERNNMLDLLMKAFHTYVEELAPYKEQILRFDDAMIEIMAIGDSELSHLENMQKIDLRRIQISKQ